jgi:hypothetical protein
MLILIHPFSHSDNMQIYFVDVLYRQTEDVIKENFSSISMRNSEGGWIRHKWYIRRGYLKIHVAVDINKIPFMYQ